MSSVDKEKRFKVGDWIIATKSLPGTPDLFSGGIWGGQPVRRDTAHMSRPVKVCGVTEAHIVYEGDTIGGDKRQWILPLEEVEQRGFIIADPILVEIANR